MKLTIKKDTNHSLGTYYGLFIGNELVHREFSRTAAEKIRDKIRNGFTLEEIFSDRATILCRKDNLKKEEYFHNLIEEQNSQIELMKKELVHYKLSLLKANNNTQKYLVKYLCKTYFLKSENAEELARLITDVSNLGFTKSSELSDYISKNNIGMRYPNISGVITMTNNLETWEYSGGFPNNIYRIICTELELLNNGSLAKVVDFVSYNTIQKL